MARSFRQVESAGGDQVGVLFQGRSGQYHLPSEPPEGVELVGFENQREIVWQTDLVRGKNLLVLPIIARNREGGSLIAEIRHGNQNKQFGLRIKVVQPDGPRSGAGRFEGSIVSTNIL